MSQENVDIVRGSWRAYANGGLDAMAGFFSEDIDWRAIEGAPDDVGKIHGIEAMSRYLGEWVEMFADLTAVPTEVIDLGNDRVLAVLHVEGRARLSGVQTELDYAVVYTLRGGRIVRGREYADRAAALKAVGLEE